MLLRRAWSLEQISGRLKSEHGRTSVMSGYIRISIGINGPAGRSLAPCAARKSGGSAMAPRVDAGRSPIKSPLMSAPLWSRPASGLATGKGIR
jgi:hypothetical protein